MVYSHAFFQTEILLRQPPCVYGHMHAEMLQMKETHFSKLPMLNGMHNPTRQTKERKSPLFQMFGWLNTLPQSSSLLVRRSPLLLPILPLILSLIQPSELC